MNEEYNDKNRRWANISLQLIKQPHNFHLWQDLVEASEDNNGEGINKISSKDAIDLVDATYVCFLKKYPHAEKYWIRYAELKFRIGDTAGARSVYEKGLARLPYSVLLWLRFLEFSIDTSTDDTDGVLDIFECARDKIGYHFYAHEFYQLYLVFLKNYATAANGYILKYYVLLRMVVEIPLYHYDYFFKELFTSISEKNLTEDLITCIVPTQHLQSYKDLPSMKSVSSKLKKIFTDVYITTQYKVYELFYFEKNIKRHYFDVTYLSNQELANWNSYLNFLELNYPQEVIILNYERLLTISALYPTFWIRYANYYIHLKRYVTAKEVLCRSLNIRHHDKVFVKLIDLELFTGNFQKSYDLMIAHLESNPSPTIQILEKLISLRRIQNFTDEKGTCELIKKLIGQTKSDRFFKLLLHYPLSKEEVLEIFKTFEEDFCQSPLYWDSLIFLYKKHNLDYYEVYEKSIERLNEQEAYKMKQKMAKELKCCKADFNKGFEDSLNVMI